MLKKVESAFLVLLSFLIIFNFASCGKDKQADETDVKSDSKSIASQETNIAETASETTSETTTDATEPTGNESSALESTSSLQEESKYDSIKDLFSKNRKELYEGYQMPSAIDTYEGSEVYKAPDFENVYYYFPLESAEEVSYLYSIAAPVSFLFDRKESVTLSELKEEFADNLKTEFSDYIGAYTAYAECDGLSFSFGEYESEENASFESVIIQKIN